MKQRNCRRTDIEKQQHERAIKIRKMTDAQICEYIDGLKKNAAAISSDSQKQVINNFICDIQKVDTVGMRLSKPTIEKIKKIADSLYRGEPE